MCFTSCPDQVLGWGKGLSGRRRGLRSCKSKDLQFLTLGELGLFRHLRNEDGILQMELDLPFSHFQRHGDGIHGLRRREEEGGGGQSRRKLPRSNLSLFRRLLTTSFTVSSWWSVSTFTSLTSSTQRTLRTSWTLVSSWNNLGREMEVFT